MEKVRLGTSDLLVSPLMVGCWSFGGDSASYWGEQDQADVDALVAEGLDRGINFFDTAVGYNDGNSEIALGKALGKRRDEAVICDKVQIQPAERLGKDYEAMVADALKRLNTSYIDLLMIHWPTRNEGLLQANLEALLKLRHKGMIREIGVSNFSLRTLEIARETGVRVVADEFAFNLISRWPERELLPYCEANRIGALAYMPLMQGVLAGKYKTIADIPLMRRRTIHYAKADNPHSSHGAPGADAEIESFLRGLRDLSEKTGLSCGTLSVAWVCHKPAVVSAIVGCRTVEQLRENAAAVETKLPPQTLKALDDLSKPVFDKLGDYPDIWKKPEESRVW
ncbi:MAG: aldo/keto reductase [Treponema sp.]|jgi:aryl-alcohol dehydrogenase-like predicted oxidoreductase|nr:aldo/keto reductase [Treponema sp.]